MTRPRLDRPVGYIGSYDLPGDPVFYMSICIPSPWQEGLVVARSFLIIFPVKLSPEVFEFPAAC